MARNSVEAMELAKAMAERGIATATGDAGAAAICARAAVDCATLNVRINARRLKDRNFAEMRVREAEEASARAAAVLEETLRIVKQRNKISD